MNIDFYNIGAVKDEDINFVVIVSRYHDKWIMARHKERTTWEIPGGHREPLEDIDLAAHRELFEETGAKEFALFPVCIYSVSNEETISFGKLYYAEVTSIGPLPNSEIEEIHLVSEFPETNLTYPLIMPFLYKKVLEYLSIIEEI
ncbi:MAG TPA: NUDIX domain-containing protein [Methylomusa anaerophila]|uniref:Putative 8-oxo-dGTP diphosphatase YtkD n=2 Tax=Methylomusa anaerophila TaxID=1930071 RepID=A0A348AIN1_9FIRM|nr:putative 8-oxo-dGTP diphosphatase YtkD [Methylomusa anaerophila]HML90443.1 NUDIX domain-containing protein [Methylomusa anaerophila]